MSPQPEPIRLGRVVETDLKTLESRRHIYRLISEVFDRLPDAELVRTFRDPSILGPIAELGFDLGLEELPKQHRQAADALRVEFTRLFIAGPGERVARFGSLYGGGADGVDRSTLWSDSTTAVARLMKATGLPPQPEGRIPDHVSVEMLFMSRLLGRRIALIDKKDMVRSNGLQVIERRFLDEHVLPWVPTFCELVERTAKLRFYEAFAQITRKFLEQESA